MALGHNLGQIRSNVVEKSKETGIPILFGKYFLKRKLVIVKPSDWKFMAIIARNGKFKGR